MWQINLWTLNLGEVRISSRLIRVMHPFPRILSNLQMRCPRTLNPSMHSHSLAHSHWLLICCSCFELQPQHLRTIRFIPHLWSIAVSHSLSEHTKPFGYCARYLGFYSCFVSLWYICLSCLLNFICFFSGSFVCLPVNQTPLLFHFLSEFLMIPDHFISNVSQSVRLSTIICWC